MVLICLRGLFGLNKTVKPILLIFSLFLGSTCVFLPVSLFTAPARALLLMMTGNNRIQVSGNLYMIHAQLSDSLFLSILFFRSKIKQSDPDPVE